MSGYTIREAEQRDNQALIALERRSPLIAGELELAFDRSPDYFAGRQLQDQSRLALAETRDGPVGVCASAVHRARLLGQERLLAYTHHMRVEPAWQRHGVGRALSRWLADCWRAEGVLTGGGYAFIDARNTNSLAFAAAGGGPGPWPIDAWLQELPATEAAAAYELAPLRPDELDDAIALINRTHDGLELFPGYTRAALLQRLSRTPAYSLQHWYAVRTEGGLRAVAGVCDVGAGLAACVRNRQTGAESISRSLALLDYGFAPGAEAAMAVLLDGLRGLAATLGRQALEVSVPECSPLFAAVAGRGADIIRFKFLGGNPRPEPGYPLRGVYIDPVYL